MGLRRIRRMRGNKIEFPTQERGFEEKENTRRDADGSDQGQQAPYIVRDDLAERLACPTRITQKDVDELLKMIRPRAACAHARKWGWCS